MSEIQATERPTVRISPWLGGGIATLLVLQLGMLWIQGSMLQRQHEDIQGLRDDVQALAESLDDSESEWDSGTEGGSPSPAHRRVERHALKATRVRYLQASTEEDDGVAKELEKSRKSATEAVAKARDVQEKLSIQENIRKANEKAKVQDEGRKIRPWLWAGAGLAVLAMLARSWMRRRG